MRSSKKSLVNVIYVIGDVIVDLTSLIIAVSLFIKYQTKESPNNIFDISQLLLGILVILFFLALNSIWDRFKKLRHIENLLSENQVLLNNKVFERIKADEFFQKDINIDSHSLEEATDILISGITLGKTSSELNPVISRRLEAGANVKIILINTSASVLDQLKERSWGVVEDDNYYKQRIEGTAELFRIVGKRIKSKGTLEIGFLPYVPSFGMTLIDSTKPGGTGFIEIYHHNTNEPKPSFEISAKNDSYWYQFFCKQFDFMWEKCDKEKVC
jgi:hypothetical protein